MERKSSDGFAAQHFLDKVVMQCHERMNLTDEVDYLDGLRDTEKGMRGQHLKLGMCLAPLTVLYCDALSRVWKHKYGITIDFSIALVAEKDTELQTIYDRDDIAHLITDPAILSSSDRATDITGKDFMLPRLLNYAGVFTSKIVSGKQETNATSILEVVSKQRPATLVMDGPLPIEDGKGASDPSADREAITKKLKELGYWCAYQEMMNCDFGGNVGGGRFWYAGIEQAEEAQHPAMTVHFLKCLKLFNASRPSVGLEACVTFSHEERMKISNMLNHPALEHIEMRDEKGSYKVEHHDLFVANHVPWPLERSSLADEAISFGVVAGGLRRREVEIVVFLNLISRMRSDCDIEFLLVAHSLAAMIKNFISPESNKLLRSPWTTIPQAVCEGGRLVVRYRVAGVTAPVVRALQPYELFQFLGIPWQAQMTFRIPSHAEGSPSERDDSLRKLVTLTASMYQYVPILAALWSTLGKFMDADGGPSGHEDADPGNDDDIFDFEPGIEEGRENDESEATPSQDSD